VSSPDQMPGQWDKLTIDTPEQTSLEFPLAGIGSRFLALALDTLIQSAAFVLLFIVAAMVRASLAAFWRGGSVWAADALWLVFFCLYFGYFAVFEALWNGQTPGKRLTRLRVIHESGRPINVYQVIARNLLRIVDQLPFFYAVGIVSALLSRQNKRLGDHVAGTVVVHEKPFAEVQPEWGSTEKAAAAPYGARRLGAEEVQLIDAFLQRRAHLSPDVRSHMAQQIAERVAQKLAVPLEQRRGPILPGGDEAFLEAVAQERRAGYR
jgi:uncharacterized RDD family membrane protein YckC